ncbi:Mitochondrial carrier protein ymc2 [Pichia californica]|uniref:Mitochondrial carrier protein ymc2 n=1 Tax=Pichia californica TaxID=460514 RepID=A0A9P6WQP0_9ASCO|nr:Mitochondrial carrier protein ymc2 [[Candida] californica]
MTQESELALLLDEPTPTSKLQSLKDIFAGTIGGVAQVLVGQPFDTTKVRLQSSSNPNTSPIDIIKSLLKNEGPLAFYKGTLLPLIGIGACVSIQFSVNESMKRIFTYYNDGPNKMNSLQFFIAGGAGGFANGFLAGPIEHVRIRLQIQTKSKSNINNNLLYNGPFSVLKHMYSIGGLNTIFRGLGPTLIRESFGIGIYFMTFEALVQNTMQKYNIKRKQVESWKLCTFGGLAGYAMWICCYPIDVIKSKMQTDTLGNWKFKNSIHVVKSILNSPIGWRGFFVGFTPTILRAAPANAATFVAFEWTMRLLD